MRLHIDLETYSATPITAGVYRYTEDPTFRILMAAWSLDGGPVRVAVGDAEIRAIPGLDSTLTKVAHNAQFERICLSRFFGLPVGQYLPPEQFHDTMGVAAELGYPQKLANLAAALGGEQKDTAGTRLIRLFCVPNRKGHRVLPEERPEEWAEFVAYCAQDVVTLVDVDRKMGGWPTEVEHRVWLADQRINDRGLAIDVPLALAAVTATDDNRMVQELELSTLTGVANPGSNVQLLAWLRASGLPFPDMRAETVATALGGPLTDVQRRVLELRQDLALVAAKKYPAALASVSSDGRLRGGFRFFGAHTGRWTGRGVQPHNLPRAGFKDPVDEEAAIVDLKLGFGAESQTLKMLVRALLMGPFTVADYAQIEARVVAWLAGERWALKAFEDGRDIYVETAARMSTPGNTLTRAQGKVAVLALGYNGGVDSLCAMGAEGSDNTLQLLVDQWRWANPAIVALWNTMGSAFRSGGPVGAHMSVEKHGRDRLIRLPSGRAIAYRDVRWDFDESGWQQASFADARGRTKTYGGRLVENATQAIARDILAEALIRLENGGFDVVGHVHDEVLCERGSVDQIVKILCDPPGWAAGLPIDASGFTCNRYRKG